MMTVIGKVIVPTLRQYDLGEYLLTQIYNQLIQSVTAWLEC